MIKVLISLDQRLLQEVDEAARRAGLSRSTYVARVLEKDVGLHEGPGRHPDVALAFERLREIGAKYPHGGDSTDAIREMRDDR